MFQGLSIKSITKYFKSGRSFRQLVLHTSFALTITSGLSYLLGLLRDRTLAYTFGASSELDIYNAVFIIPDFLLAFFVTSALSAAFIPIFTQCDEKDKGKAMAYTNQILAFMIMLVGVFGAAIAIFMPQLAEFFVPGFSGEELEKYITATRIMLLSPILFAISNTFGGILISIRGFFWYGIAPALYNLGIIIGALFLAPHFGVYGLVIGTIFGAFLHMSIRAVFVVLHGYRFKFQLEFTPELRETVRLMIPRIFQIGMWQVLLFWFVRLASSLPEGSVTVYSFARNFQSVPVSLIGIAIALASFSQLSHLAAKSKFQEFKSLLWRKSYLILGITALAAAVMAVISRPLISILLGGGEFDNEAIRLTASILAVYAISIPLESIMHLLARAHYALKNTMRPALFHIFAISCTILLSSYLVQFFGLFAIPVSFTVGLFIDVLLLLVSQKQLLDKKL